MTQAEFLLHFDPVLEAFGSHKFPPIVLERIQKRAFDFSTEEFKTLCHLVIENCDRAPTTAKVGEFINIVRGKRAGSTAVAQIPIDCNACDDLGVLRVIDRDSTFETLIRCNCAEGKRSTWKLPVYDRLMTQLFEVAKCPMTWFKPELPVGKIRVKESDEPLDARKMKLPGPIQEKVDNWRSRIRVAEMYWEAERKKAGA